MRIFKYIVSVCLLVISLNANGQYFEKRKRDWKPSEFYLSMDVVELAKMVSGSDVEFEIQGKVDFDIYHLVLDWGINQLEFSGEGFDYSVQGNFFRVGPQVNLIPYNELRSNIYFGVMYGQSKFSDEIVYSKPVVHWPEENLRFQNSDLVSRWLEFNMGITSIVYKNFYAGFLLRFKFANTSSDVDTLSPYLVPGYGRADKLNRFGFNYYLTYRIPFRDKPIPVKPRYIPGPPEQSEGEKNSKGGERGSR